MDIRLLTARVGHIRHVPKRNSFTYRVYYTLFPVYTTPHLPHLFSIDHWNALSVYTRDHGPKDGSDWEPWLKAQCHVHGFPWNTVAAAYLIAHPRLYGYAFNPISFWLLMDIEKNIRAVLCEVHNTFGDDHNYFLFHKDYRPIQADDIFSAPKHLYVSPFNPMSGSYTFRFAYTENTYAAHISYMENNTPVVETHLEGTHTPLTTGAIIRTLIQYPLMTFMVFVRIHLQALRILVKGVPHTLGSRPPHTTNETTQSSYATTVHSPHLLPEPPVPHESSPN